MIHFSRQQLARLRLFSGIGAGATGYLVILLFSGKIDCLAGCGVDQGCVDAFDSKWSRWLGIPVILPGFLIHCGVWIGSLRALGTRNPHAQLVGLGTAALLLGFSAIWFGSILVFVEKQFCIYCTVFHAMGIAILITLVRSVMQGMGNCVWKVIALAMILFGALVAGQLI